MKNALWGINSRVEKTENQPGDLEYKEAKSTQPKHQEEKRI